MEALIKIGDTFVWLADRIWDTWRLVDGIPLIADPLSGLFDAGYNFCWWMRDEFYKLSERWDTIEARIGTILSWEGIKELVRSSWGFLDDVRGYVWEYVFNKLRAIYPWLDNVLTYVWHYVYEKIRQAWSWLDDISTKIKDESWELITTRFTWITDFWGNVAQAIWDWFSANFFPWLEDRSSTVVAVGGRILEGVW